MDSRGGCCIARYAGGGAYDLSKVDRIMLRFRPIAPKPVTVGSVSGGSTSDGTEVYAKSGRGKRKYARENNSYHNSKRCYRKRRVLVEEKKDGLSSGDAMVTLPLLPETPDRKESPARGSLVDNCGFSVTTKHVRNVPMWLSFGGHTEDDVVVSGFGGLPDRTVARPQTTRVVGSCVTVECVTDTWVDGDGLGSTDEERMRNLEKDTCPGFISNALGGVTWTNGAYREMVGQAADGGEAVVWLVMKERVTLRYPAFSCRVRVQYTCGKEKSSLILPCDVWRMGIGGFAWRLDVKAALSLGR